MTQQYSEKWFYQQLPKLDRAIDWAKKHLPKDNFDQFIKKVTQSKNKK